GDGHRGRISYPRSFSVFYPDFDSDLGKHMSLASLLSNLPSVTVKGVQNGIMYASVAKEQFTAALDELVNCRTLAAATYALGIEDAGALYSQGLSLAMIYGTDDRMERGTFGVHALLHDDTAQA